MPNVHHKGIMRIKWKMCNYCCKNESKLFTVLNVKQIQDHCVRCLSLVLLEHVEKVNTSKLASKWSQNRSANMNKSLSRVSSTESLYQFQTTGVWLTTAIISLPNFWLVYYYCASSVVENVKHSLTSSIPLSDFFFLCRNLLFESRFQIHAISSTNTCTFYPTSCNSSLRTPRCLSLYSSTLAFPSSNSLCNSFS